MLSPSQLQGEDALRAALAAAQSTIEDLQMEAETAQQHADKLGVDVERFNRKLEVQILSGKEMGMEMSALVAERDQLKDEVEWLLLAKQTSQEQELDADNARFAHVCFFVSFVYLWSKGFVSCGWLVPSREAREVLL